MSTPTALVTGATSGIGYAATALLVAGGWEVWVTGRDGERVDATAAQLACRPLLLDVTDPAGVAAAAGRVSELDVLVNNAGIQAPSPLCVPPLERRAGRDGRSCRAPGASRSSPSPDPSSLPARRSETAVRRSPCRAPPAPPAAR